MNKFNIEVISKKPVLVNGCKRYKGQITIGDFKENFYMAVDNWTVSEYKKQWKEGINRIKTHNSSCLVVNFAGSIENPWIELWTLYKEGETIFIHNQCLFDEIFKEASKGLPQFDANTCYLYVTPRETETEEGYKISEWQTTIHNQHPRQETIDNKIADNHEIKKSNFKIETIGKINKQGVCKGQITIGDFKGIFHMSIDLWKLNQYKQQWKEGLNRIKMQDISCLVVDYAGPKENPWIQLWVLYREGDIIFIQSHYLFYEIFQERSKGLPPFDAKTCYLYVLPRETINEEGAKIAEWQTTIHDLPSL